MLNGKMYVDSSNYVYNWDTNKRCIKSSSINKKIKNDGENSNYIYNKDSFFNIKRTKNNFQLRDQFHNVFNLKEIESKDKPVSLTQKHINKDEPIYIKYLKFEVDNPKKERERPSTNKIGSFRVMSKQISAKQFVDVNSEQLNRRNSSRNNLINEFNANHVLKKTKLFSSVTLEKTSEYMKFKECQEYDNENNRNKNNEGVENKLMRSIKKDKETTKVINSINKVKNNALGELTTQHQHPQTASNEANGKVNLRKSLKEAIKEVKESGNEKNIEKKTNLRKMLTSSVSMVRKGIKIQISTKEVESNIIIIINRVSK